MRQRARVVLRVRGNLGKGDVAGCLDEFLELPVRNRRTVDPERVHGDAMDRCLFRIVLVRTHAECAAANEHHVVGGPTRMRQAFRLLFRAKAVEQCRSLPRFYRRLNSFAG